MENLTTYKCTKEGLHRHIHAQGLVWTRPLLTRPHACSTISILWEMTTNNLAVSSTGQTSYWAPNNHTVMYWPYHQDKINHLLPLQITPTAIRLSKSDPNIVCIESNKTALYKGCHIQYVLGKTLIVHHSKKEVEGKREGWLYQRWKVKQTAGKGRTRLVLFDPVELCYSERLAAAKSVCELWAFLQRSHAGNFQSSLYRTLTVKHRPTKWLEGISLLFSLRSDTR